MPAQPAISAKRAAKLGAKKHREAARLFLAEGEAFLREAPVPPVHVFRETEEIRRVSTLATPAGPVGVFPFLDVATEALLASTQRLVLLHGVQDPGNVGTVVRSAHAFEAGVALSRGCADLYNPKTVRATMGSIFYAPIAREVDSVAFLRVAERQGFTPVAAVPEGGEARAGAAVERSVIAVGAEGAGLPKEVVEACRHRVTIPSEAPSLNAAMAASILLYDAYLRVLP